MEGPANLPGRAEHVRVGEGKVLGLGRLLRVAGAAVADGHGIERQQARVDAVEGVWVLADNVLFQRADGLVAVDAHSECAAGWLAVDEAEEGQRPCAAGGVAGVYVHVGV